LHALAEHSDYGPGIKFYTTVTQSNKQTAKEKYRHDTYSAACTLIRVLERKR
jgi:hypothetical protein